MDSTSEAINGLPPAASWNCRRATEAPSPKTGAPDRVVGLPMSGIAVAFVCTDAAPGSRVLGVVEAEQKKDWRDNCSNAQYRNRGDAPGRIL